MKKAVILVLFLLILAACGNAPRSDEPSAAQQLAEQLREEAANPAPSESEPTVTETVEPAPAPEVETIVLPPAPEPQQTTVEPTPVETPVTDTAIVGEETDEPALGYSTMQELLNVFATKVQSYQFTHNNSRYSVKGHKIKIILAKPVQVREYTWPNGTRKSFFTVDTIYIDRASQTATAYCEGHLERVNEECDNTGVFDYPYPVPFLSYNILLPQDWLLNWLDKTPTQIEPDKYYVKGRKVTLLRFNESPLRTELSIDAAIGLPVRIEQFDGGKMVYRQDFDYLASNRVRDVDVVHRSKAEIPSEEVFYNQNIVNTASGY